jgi:hypothetical protein
MRDDLVRTLRSLLDSSGGLGVGLVDGNGLLVHGEGEHAGLPAAVVAAEVISLWQRRHLGLVRALHDACLEQIVVGERHSVLTLRYSPGYVIYLLAGRDTPTGRLRPLLHDAAAALTPLCGERLVRAARQRLEQPRQFGDRRLR